MSDVNWWLMLLAFLLGAVLTFAMTIRRVTREVPVGGSAAVRATAPSAGRAVAAGGAAATLAAAAGKVAEKAEKAGAKAEAKTEQLAGRVVEKAERAEKAVAGKIGDVLERDPYGTGSIRVTRRSAAPEGYTIKGDKDTMRYFTLDSPEYAAIEAEVWFADEPSAQAAGFLRWDAAAGATPADAGAAAAATVVSGGTSGADSAATVVTGGDTDPAEIKAVITGGDTDASATAARIVDTSGPDRPGTGR